MRECGPKQDRNVTSCIAASLDLMRFLGSMQRRVRRKGGSLSTALSFLGEEMRTEEMGELVVGGGDGGEDVLIEESIEVGRVDLGARAEDGVGTLKVATFGPVLSAGSTKDLKRVRMRMRIRMMGRRMREDMRIRRRVRIIIAMGMRMRMLMTKIRMRMRISRGGGP